MGRTQSQTDRQKNLFAERSGLPFHRMGRVMSSVPPSSPRVALRRMDEDPWIAISLIALLGAAIIACAALTSLYLHAVLATDLLIES
jgi:hypothetical protein